MSFRLYVVPVIGTGTTASPRRPKYFGSTSSPWSAMDYGFEPWMVVGASLTELEDLNLTAQPDVTALPVNLQPLLSAGNVTAIQTKLEAANIPAGWVNTTLTWTEVVRTVLGMFSFLQRYGVTYATANGSAPPSIFSAGVTLATTFGSLPAAVQTALTDTAVSFGIATTGLTASTTLRQILKSMADHFQGTPYFFGAVTV